jgi:hypothetical protein
MGSARDAEGAAATAGKNLPLLAAALYALIGTAWILLVDLLLARWLGNLWPTGSLCRQALEGALRIVVVGGLLFLGLRRALRAVARSRAELAGRSERLGLLARGVREYAFIDLSPEGIVLSWNPGRSGSRDTSRPRSSAGTTPVSTRPRTRPPESRLACCARRRPTASAPPKGGACGATAAASGRAWW